MRLFKDKTPSKNEQEGYNKNVIEIPISNEISYYQEFMDNNLLSLKISAFLMARLPEFAQEISPIIETSKHLKSLGHEEPEDWHTILSFVRENSGNNNRRLSLGSIFILQNNTQTNEKNLYLIPDFREVEDSGVKHTIYAKDRGLGYEILEKGQNPKRLSAEEFENVYNSPDNQTLDVKDGISFMFRED